MLPTIAWTKLEILAYAIATIPYSRKDDAYSCSDDIPVMRNGFAVAGLTYWNLRMGVLDPILARGQLALVLGMADELAPHG